MLLAVIGKPVLHSKSPYLHSPALAALDVAGAYTRLAADSAAHALSVAREIGMCGLNVTAPFKEEMCRCVDVLSDEARAVQAVNTVCIDEKGITSGYNTDVYGVLQSLNAHHVAISGKDALVLGAGGAARAAVYALISAGAQVTIANRTKEKAVALASEFGCHAVGLSADELHPVLKRSAILISVISTTERLVPREFLKPGLTLLDALYADCTSLSRDALDQGVQCIGGLEWLLYQGAQAFEYFTGKSAPVSIMHEGIRGARREPARSLALVGMMGTGKSATAVELSKLLGRPLIELDQLIEQRAGKSIPTIFAQDGEVAFRALEETALKQALEKPGAIISCGGGIVGSENNRALLAEESIIAWLWAPVDELLHRLRDQVNRPLLMQRDPRATLSELLATRKPLYASISDLIVPTSGKTPRQVAERIKYETDKVWHG